MEKILQEKKHLRAYFVSAYLRKLINTLHYDYLKKLITTFLSINSTLSMARLTIKLKAEVLNIKQKHGQPKANNTSKCTKKS